MILLIERGIRGGVSNVFKRHAVANNQYLNSYDPKMDSSFIVYLDCNNLYGMSLSLPLPINGFRWCDINILEDIDWINIDENSDKGYIIECDLNYPKELHELHDNFPLAPEKLTIQNEFLSDYQHDIINFLKNNQHKRVPTEKLLTTLYDKKNYVIHSSVLKFYLENGLKLIRIHKGIEFSQKAWLRPYIELNTTLRQQSKNDFEKNFYKLMSNAVFGKSIEQKRSHRDIKIALTPNQAKIWIKKPHFKKFSIIDENKVIIEMNKTKVFLDRPIFIGFSCLDLSKCHMYKLFYSLFKRIYDNKCSLLMSDTDSLLMEIKTKDIFKDFALYSDMLDLSDYPNDHFSGLKSDINKKVIGVLKDEMNGKLIDEFIGIKSKMYSIKFGESSKLVAKGVQKQVLKNYIDHENYRNCLFQKNLTYAKMRSIRSKDHQIKTLEQWKLVFTPLNDKRFYIDAINSLSFGHFRINDISNVK